MGLRQGPHTWPRLSTRRLPCWAGRARTAPATDRDLQRRGELGLALRDSTRDVQHCGGRQWRGARAILRSTATTACPPRRQLDDAVAGLETLFLRSLPTRQNCALWRGRRPALGRTRVGGPCSTSNYRTSRPWSRRLWPGRRTTRANHSNRCSPKSRRCCCTSFLSASSRPGTAGSIPMSGRLSRRWIARTCLRVFPTCPRKRADQFGALAFPASTIAALQGLKPDVILHCAPGPVPDALCPLARFGVWSIHLGEPTEPRSPTPCFLRGARRAAALQCGLAHARGAVRRRAYAHPSAGRHRAQPFPQQELCATHVDRPDLRHLQAARAA